MKTYKVIENWETFKNFIINQISSEDQNKIVVLHRENEIYIRSTDIKLLNIIRKKYKLVLSEQPNLHFDKDIDGAMGNKNLLDR
jgi:hypothetical protein